jgi:hypothetical protein
MNALAHPSMAVGGAFPPEIRSAESQRALLRFLLAVSALAMPLLVPRLPGNSVPVDIVNATVIVLGVILLVRTRAPLRAPLAVPVFMILLGGLLAAMQSVAIEQSLLAITQDVYLFAVFVIVVNLIVQDRSGLTARFLAGAWATTGVAVGALTWVVQVTQTDYLFGVRMVDPYGRAHGTLRDPNMTGAYLVTSLFVLWLAPWPRRIPTKLVSSIPIVLGIHATGSNTALITLAGGALATLAVALIARQSKGEQRIAATLVLVGLIALPAILIPDAIVRADRSLDTLGQTSTFESSLGRVDASMGPRIERWRGSLELFRDELVVGIGPSATNEWLDALNARVAGEIHNDYVAGFLERGPLGGFGNLLLLAGIVIATIRVALSDRLGREGWLPSAAFGAAVSVLLAGNALEILHFRHVWLLFALVVALQMFLTEHRVPTEPQT